MSEDNNKMKYSQCIYEYYNLKSVKDILTYNRYL